MQFVIHVHSRLSLQFLHEPSDGYGHGCRVLDSLSQVAFFGGVLRTRVVRYRAHHSASWSEVAAAMVCKAWRTGSRGKVQRGALLALSPPSAQLVKSCINVSEIRSFVKRVPIQREHKVHLVN